jgi:translation initiation factor 2 subunit 1
MYENPFPNVDDLVMVKVKSIAEMGAYVSLLEYGDREGMILLSELSRRRIRSINKLIKVGKQEVVVVLRVDQEKGYIDLSKRRVSPEEIAKCEERFSKSKHVHSILRHVAEVMHRPMEELYSSIGWPLFRAYGHAYDAFMLAIHDEEVVFGKLKELGHDIPTDIREELMENIKRRLTPKPLKMRADFEATCFTYDGIDAIREALRKGETACDNQCQFSLVAPPLYVVSTNTLEKEGGVKLLTIALEAAAAELQARGGEMTVKARGAARCVRGGGADGGPHRLRHARSARRTSAS